VVNDASRDVLEFEVTSEQAGQRIDRVVLHELTGFGRRATALLFAEGRVELDGSLVKKGTMVSAGQIISVRLPPPDAAAPYPEAELSIVLLREELVIVDKPAGMPSAALRTSTRSTLAGALVARFPELGGIGFGPREPGLIHRLDTQTSGLVIAARSKAAFTALRSAMTRGELTKKYLALICPSDEVPEHGHIEAPLAPHPKNRRKVAVVTPSHPHAREAHTDFRVVERSGELVLIELCVGRAYRHQIRAHLAWRGWPLLGDALYGGRAHPSLAPARHALHASYIRCDAKAIERFEVSSPLPPDMREAFERPT